VGLDQSATKSSQATRQKHSKPSLSLEHSLGWEIIWSNVHGAS